MGLWVLFLVFNEGNRISQNVFKNSSYFKLKLR
ncbi:cysteine desulfurase, partial [Helicobacter pylori]